MIIVSAEIKRERAINNAMLFGELSLLVQALLFLFFIKETAI